MTYVTWGSDDTKDTFKSGEALQVKELYLEKNGSSQTRSFGV